ncbi:Silencing in the middle of the centromere 3 [Hyphodiscus hymeniophilus]|uniref:Silencing in the middle of the centromere 3 n=1 Tax=Hyphodiscus hymeniophilus TaxID=353542 RepID=A0A9P6VQQ4_9HELO|nr:Silencing in the middle of the centromere 3 [Hyphodiscus hymeniophilus]
MAEPVELSTSTTLTEENETPMSAEDAFNSVKVSLADLCAKATAQYAHKNYDEASDLFARASELQAELNGEMSPENAEILFLYGRSLFKVGQSKSDVLGGRAGTEKKQPNGAAKAKKAEPAKEKSELDSVAEEGVAIIAEQNGSGVKAEEGGAKQPLFQFTGDENFEDSDDDEAEEAGGEAEEEDDDLAAAFEVLDLARVLYSKKLEEPEEGGDKGKVVGDSLMTKHIKERMADTHDLLAEISLENERFPGAVVDFRSALALKQDLHPEESEIVAEAHFKLSLALEFASITRTQEDGGEPKGEEDETHIDQDMRDEAVTELEAAIKSTRLKLQNKEVELASSNSPEDNEVIRAQIADVKEIVADMEGRLAELRKPPVDVKDVLYGPTSGSNTMGGILGATLGESPADASARIEEAKKTATDLTGLVRRKAKPEASTPEASAGTNGTNGKRKAADDIEDSDAKKAKVEDVVDG